MSSCFEENDLRSKEDQYGHWHIMQDLARGWVWCLNWIITSSIFILFLLFRLIYMKLTDLHVEGSTLPNIRVPRTQIGVYSCEVISEAENLVAPWLSKSTFVLNRTSQQVRRWLWMSKVWTFLLTKIGTHHLWPSFKLKLFWSTGCFDCLSSQAVPPCQAVFLLYVTQF